MTMRIKYVALSLMAFVVACASKPVAHHYYLIESPAPTNQINSSHQIVLYPIKLSDYLNSHSLHVKNDVGEVLYSATDSWAEQPDKMLWRVISKELEKQSGHHILASYETLSSCAQIKVRINELSPTTTGRIVSNGRWFISAGGKTLKTNTFSYIGDIRVDGYFASNEVFLDHLSTLSVEINEQINKLNLCQN